MWYNACMTKIAKPHIFQQWNIHSFPGQTLPASHQCLVKNFHVLVNVNSFSLNSLLLVLSVQALVNVCISYKLSLSTEWTQWAVPRTFPSADWTTPTLSAFLPRTCWFSLQVWCFLDIFWVVWFFWWPGGDFENQRVFKEIQEFYCQNYKHIPLFWNIVAMNCYPGCTDSIYFHLMFIKSHW